MLGRAVSPAGVSTLDDAAPAKLGLLRSTHHDRMTNGDRRDRRRRAILRGCSAASPPSSPCRSSSSARPDRTRRSRSGTRSRAGAQRDRHRRRRRARASRRGPSPASAGVVTLLSASEPAFRRSGSPAPPTSSFSAHSRSTRRCAVGRPDRSSGAQPERRRRRDGAPPGRRLEPRQPEDRALLREPAAAVRPGRPRPGSRLPCARLPLLRDDARLAVALRGHGAPPARRARRRRCAGCSTP